MPGISEGAAEATGVEAGDGLAATGAGLTAVVPSPAWPATATVRGLGAGPYVQSGAAAPPQPARPTASTRATPVHAWDRFIALSSPGSVARRVAARPAAARPGPPVTPPQGRPRMPLGPSTRSAETRVPGPRRPARRAPGRHRRP